MHQPSRIGNDVVDLGDPSTAGAHERPRYVGRVCTGAEGERVRAAQDPCALLWSFFAAKEAAFKAVSKARPGIIFAHRRFEVALDLGSVSYEELTVPVQIDNDGLRIHALALLSGPGGPNALTSLAADDEAPILATVQEVGDGADSSAAVRALLRRELGIRLGCSAESLKVRRPAVPGSWDGYGPPRLLRDGAPAGWDISLSHHGRFVACAATPDPSGLPGSAGLPVRSS